MSFYNEAQAMAGYLTDLRREFHRHPCISREEFWTAERIERELDAIGVTEHRRVDGSAVVASIFGEGEGDRVMALRADIDALAIREADETREYRSREEGKMHACGHDAHTSALIGAARLLHAHRSEFGGEVRLIFEHAEEMGYGARVLISEGALDGVGRIFGIHMAPDMVCGKVGVRVGPNVASVDHFTVKVHGAAAHVSVPHQGVDALYIASQIVVALQALVTRRSSPVEPLVIGVGKLHAGSSYNIVAPYAELEGTTRAFSVERRETTNAEIDRLCKGIAEIYGGSAEIEWEDFGSPIINPELPCKEAGEVVTDLFGGDALVTDRPICCIGDDFSEYQLKVPGVYAFVGSCDPTRPDTGVPLHNDRFDIDERVIPMVAAMHAEYAVRYLTGTLER